MTLREFIELFEAGYDDKVYIRLVYNEFEEIFENVRIIDGKLKPYLENKVYALNLDIELVVFIEK